MSKLLILAIFAIVWVPTIKQVESVNEQLKNAAVTATGYTIADLGCWEVQLKYNDPKFVNQEMTEEECIKKCFWELELKVSLC